MCDVEDGETGMSGRKAESRQVDLELIRAWAMGLGPAEGKSTHWWYADLDTDAKDAFDRCAHSSQVGSQYKLCFKCDNGRATDLGPPLLSI